MARLSDLFWAFCVASLMACSATDPTRNMPVGSTYERAEDSRSTVVLAVEHVDEAPIGRGFRVYVVGWEPNDRIEVVAYDDAKRKVDVVVGEKALPVSSDGKVSFTLPYDFHAFRPGRWLIVVTGKSGKHAFYVDIPGSGAPGT